MKLSKKTARYGFTLVELLIVIVVIAVLATISIVAYNGIQERAKATAIAAGIRETDKAMRLALYEEGRGTWWSDEDHLDGDGESSLMALIEGTALKNYISAPPRVTGEDDSFWMYDNDMFDPDDEPYDPNECPVSHRSGGVNLQIELRSNSNLAHRINQMVDGDDNLYCGVFREHHSNPGEYLYLLSSDQNLF